MTLTWQDGLVLGIVLVAAAHVLRHVWRVGTFKSRLGCGARRSCKAHYASQELIQIALPVTQSEPAAQKDLPTGSNGAQKSQQKTPGQ